MIRVLLAEDQAMVRGALTALLGMETDIEVVGSAPDGETAWRELQRLKPDLLVTDIEMPHLTGLDLALRVRDAGLAPRVGIITTFARAGYLRRALDAGVRGYLLKDAPSGQLAAALRQVHAGGRVIDPQLAVAAWGEEDPLTERERQVLRTIASGHSNKVIGHKLGITEGTVKVHVKNLLHKLGLRSRVEAAVWAMEHLRNH